MPSFTSILLGNSVIACVIALAALLALLLRRPALSHVLWLIVLVKLVTPPVVRVPVSLPWTASPVEVAADVSPVEVQQPVESSAATDEVREATPIAIAPSVVVERPNHITTIRDWCGGHASTLLLTLWAVGTLAYLARLLVFAKRFNGVLQTSSSPDAAVLAEVRDVADRIGLSTAPLVRIVDAAVSPMVICLRREPQLILPGTLVAELSSDALRAVIAHELAHLRRKDHWVRWLESAATALMWWHPLLWLARRGLHEAEEQCCDAWVVWTLPGNRRAYADALVTTASLLSESAAAALPPGASGLGQFQQLKRRLIMIMHQNTRHGLSSFGKVLAAAMLLALPILPAIAEDKPAPATAKADGPDAKDAEIKALKAELNRLNLARIGASIADPSPEKKKDHEIAELKIEIAGARAALAARRGVADDGKPDAKPTDKKEEAQADYKAPRPQIESEISRARARMRQDSQKYSRPELQEAESLYQVANKSWRSPEAKASLEQMVKKFPKINRTGCAVLYLGQYSTGEEREKYLKQAVEDFSDCFYGNGVQVGAFGRYLLGHYYREKGEFDKGNALLTEIVKKYPRSITHKGDQLAKIAQDDLKKSPDKAPAGN